MFLYNYPLCLNGDEIKHTSYKWSQRYKVAELAQTAQSRSRALGKDFVALLVCALGPLEGSDPQVVGLAHLTALMIYLDTDADLWSRTDKRKG